MGSHDLHFWTRIGARNRRAPSPQPSPPMGEREKSGQRSQRLLTSSPTGTRGARGWGRLALGAVAAALLVFPCRAERTTVSLDGTWQVEESVSGTDMPKQFTHKAPVPGMANLARPAFKDVDLFDSRELISNRIRSKKLPESARVNTAGTPRQDRNYFWYRRDFDAPAQRAVAMLKINKAQFGTAVWLNGQKLGEYPGCFTASYFRLDEAIKWQGNNTLVVRVGAHPGVLPDTFMTGTDFEKLKWTSGIYDSVSVYFCDNPVIETIQVAPRVASSEIVVQTQLKNYGTAPCVFNLQQRVWPWKGERSAASAPPEPVTLAAGEVKTITQTFAIPNAHLWTPEDPFLYVLMSSTGGDSVSTRFGMREFRSDATTKRFYLNGKPYYLRGSNITLHRFFEDPSCGDLPWNEKWLRKLLVEIPREMHWNSFRFCIGPVPDRWLELADEAGLLIQNEYFVWTGAPTWDTNYFRKYDVDQAIHQYQDWMRDNWNHPSVAIWDANNETKEPLFGEKIIPAVRDLDLSKRPWENSYNAPAGPDDPVEHHPYLCIGAYFGGLKFRMSDLETMDARPKMSGPQAGHPVLINEYGWLWLNRDGSPTLLTGGVYAALLGTNATPEQRFALNAYMLAGKTEFWRASRQYAGILHFVYLTCSYPGVYTSDHWLDVKKLKLEPHFADYMSEAFKPLGVYLNFFQPTLKAGTSREFTVMMVNDEAKSSTGRLILSVETKSGKVLSRAQVPYALGELGDQKYQIALPIPDFKGDVILKATAQADQKGRMAPTVCRRWVKLD